MWRECWIVAGPPGISHHHGADWNKPEAIADYLQFLEAGQIYATIAPRLAAIHKILEIGALADDTTEFEDPTKHPKVTVTLQAIRRRLGTDQGPAARSWQSC